MKLEFAEEIEFAEMMILAKTLAMFEFAIILRGGRRPVQSIDWQFLFSVVMMFEFARELVPRINRQLGILSGDALCLFLLLLPLKWRAKCRTD